jgi:hypothetical protein
MDKLDQVCKKALQHYLYGSLLDIIRQNLHFNRGQ